MQLVLVAEGVEDRETADILQEMGVEMLQGYYFSRPMPQEECTNFIVGLSAMDVQSRACCGISGTPCSAVLPIA